MSAAPYLRVRQTYTRRWVVELIPDATFEIEKLAGPFRTEKEARVAMAIQEALLGRTR